MIAIPPASTVAASCEPTVLTEPTRTAMTVGDGAYVNAVPLPNDDCPPAVTTLTLTGPAGRAGETATIWPSETTVKLDAGVEPKLTAVAPVNAEPEIVTLVPPPSGPAAGLTLDTAGAVVFGEETTRYEKWSEAPLAEVPPGVVTVTSTVPADPAGTVAVIELLELTTTDVAGLPPTMTAVPDVKPVPVIVIDVPPLVAPALGETLVTDGTGS